MKKIKLAFRAILLFSCAAMVAGCSEHSNDEEYRSLCPRFSDVTLTALDGGTTLRVGDRIVATAVQSSYGRLLSRASYSWSCSPSDGVSHAYKTSVIYDKEAQHPTDTIVFSEPGSYTLTLKANYSISGGRESVNGTVNFDNGSVTYQSSTITYMVTVTKRFRVVNQ